MLRRHAYKPLLFSFIQARRLRPGLDGAAPCPCADVGRGRALGADAAALDFDPGGEVIPVRNKIDLDGEAPGVRGGTVFVSAKSGAGMDALRGEILRVAGFCESEPPFSARERHLRALDSALGFARQARRDWTHPELAAEGLRRARDALASITGDFGNEELLGEIFSRFCVGK